MQFEAPEIFREIPDLAAIYRANAAQSEALDAATQELDDDVFLSDMRLPMVERWEGILGAAPLASDTLEDRRTRVKALLTDTRPLTWRYLREKLDLTYGKGNYDLELDGFDLSLTIYAGDPADIADWLDRSLPLNIIFDAYRGTRDTATDWLPAVFQHDKILTRREVA